jgi:hypothetical protein
MPSPRSHSPAFLFTVHNVRLIGVQQAEGGHERADH